MGTAPIQKRNRPIDASSARIILTAAVTTFGYSSRSTSTEYDHTHDKMKPIMNPFITT